MPALSTRRFPALPSAEGARHRGNGPTAIVVNIFRSQVASRFSSARLYHGRQERPQGRATHDSNGSAAIVNWNLSSVSSYQDSVVGQTDNCPFIENPGHGIFNGFPVCSLMMLNISPIGLWEASRRGQPVNASAMPFINMTLPMLSVEMTASPILDKVTRSNSRCRRISSSCFFPCRCSARCYRTQEGRRGTPYISQNPGGTG